MSCPRAVRSLLVVSLVTALTLITPPAAQAAETPPGPGTLRLEMIGAGPEPGDGTPPAAASFLVRNVADGATMATPSSAQLLGNDGGPCPGVVAGALCSGDLTLTVAATGTELHLSVAQGPTDRLAAYSGDCDGGATTQNVTSGRVRLARGETKVCRVTFVRPDAGGVTNADTALLVRTSFDHDPAGIGRPNQRLDLRGGNASIASADLGELTDLSDPTSPCPLSAPQPLCEWAVAFDDDDFPSPFRVQESPHPEWLPIFGGACDPRGTLPTGRALGGELVRCDIEHVHLESQDGTGRNAAVRFEVIAPAGPGSPDSSTLEVRSFDGDALAAIDTQEMRTATGQPCPGVDLDTCTGDVGLTVDVDPRVALTERFTIHATALPPGYQAGFSGSCTTRTPVNGLPFGQIDLGVGTLAACRVTVIPSPTPPPPPVLSVGDLRIREGSSGTVPANVRIDLSTTSPLPVTVSASTSNGTATAPADYTSVSVVVTIPAGQSSVLVPVPIVGDVFGEPDETFAVTLGAPTGATIGDGAATVTIVNDDDRTPPVIAVKPNVIAESRLAPVSVVYSSPAATDNLEGSVAVTCVAKSGAKFAFGSTTVTCSAADRNGNVAKSSFVVLVRLPTTSGAVTRPGASSTDALQEVHRRQPVQVDAGGFAPRTRVELVFVTSTGDHVTLARTRAGRDGRIDVVVRIPRVPLGEGQMTAIGVASDGSSLVRAWLLTTVPWGGRGN